MWSSAGTATGKLRAEGRERHTDLAVKSDRADAELQYLESPRGSLGVLVALVDRVSEASRRMARDPGEFGIHGDWRAQAEHRQLLVGSVCGGGEAGVTLNSAALMSSMTVGSASGKFVMVTSMLSMKRRRTSGG